MRNTKEILNDLEEFSNIVENYTYSHNKEPWYLEHLNIMQKYGIKLQHNKYFFKPSCQINCHAFVYLNIYMDSGLIMSGEHEL